LESKETYLQVDQETALLVNVTLPDSKIGPVESLAELESLAEAAGANVLGAMYQKRRKINPAYFVGRGKAVEIGERAKELGAKTVIFDADLSPGQIRDLEKVIERKVLDRSELILDIFASRAQTHEAKLQVELAQMQYTYPRLTRMWSHLDTVVGAGGGLAGAVGGIGTRGPGEKQLEIDRRLVKKRISDLREQIEKIDQRKKRQVQTREKHFTVSLVGYTNAGKSTLMNTLTGIDTFVANKLFATLDTKTTRWNLGQDHTVLLSDTVGFVRDLPHHLVASFRATLEEAIHADLLLHVVDVAHPQAEMQMQAVEKVLAEMGCQKKDTLLLFNKMDKLDARSQGNFMKTLYPQALAVSARSGLGTDKLVEEVIRRVTGDQVRLRILYEQANGRIPSFMRANGKILSENYLDSQVIMEAYLGREQLPGLTKLQPSSWEIIN